MNDADSPSINLDELRLVPDWMRDGAPSPSKQYASHGGPSDRELRPDSRGPRQGQGGPGRERRDPRAGGPRPGGQGGRDAGRSGPGGPRPSNRRDGRPGDNRPPRDDAPAYPPSTPAPVQVVFQPDDLCLASIVKQIRSTHLAYPLFSLARMFLQEPARHWVQFTVVPAAAQAGTALSQLGEDGPVTLDRATLERIAFDSAREQYYVEQTVQKEPLKGNFANVARERTSGTLLGPTNHHGYQPALRALYESRFSRRMSFDEYRRNVEIVSDPALVERWKEEARTVTTIVTKDGDPPASLQNVTEARAHFRQHYFEGLIQSGTVRRVHGTVARNLPEGSMMQAIRQAHETELRYPAQFVQLLREGLQNAGLHIFKHRKRVVYVSIVRPTPFVAGDGAVSENVAALLDVIGKFPLCTRKTIAEHVLAKPLSGQANSGESRATESATELKPTDTESGAMEASVSPVLDAAARAKAALAADLRFLVQAGHIIEFHNGTFDLPLPPKAKEEPAAASKASAKQAADDVGADPATATAAASEDALPVTEQSAPVEAGATEPFAGSETASETPSSSDDGETPVASAEPAAEPEPVETTPAPLA